MRGRILFEEIPGGTEYLQLVVEAMQQNSVLSIEYRRFGHPKMAIHFEPYAMKRAEQMIASVCSMAIDDEVAAEIQYQLCNFKTVAERYPNTQKGELVRGKCDKLYDYHTERYTPRQR